MKYDKWHFIIPCVVLSVQIPVSVELTVYCLLSLISVQFFYEWYQFVDYNCPDTYGSYQNFVINTKKDIKFFIFGMFIGLFIGFLIYSFITKFI